MELRNSSKISTYSQTKSFISSAGESGTWIDKCKEIDEQVNHFLFNDKVVDCEKTETIILPDQNMARVVTYVVAHINDKAPPLDESEMESLGMMENTENKRLAPESSGK